MVVANKHLYVQVEGGRVVPAVLSRSATCRFCLIVDNNFTLPTSVCVHTRAPERIHTCTLCRQVHTAKPLDRLEIALKCDGASVEELHRFEIALK